MKKKLSGIVLAFIFSTFVLCGVSSAGTLDALPIWTSPHMITHFDEAASAVGRLAESFFLDNMLEGIPSCELIKSWLKNTPIKSVSTVKGVMYEDEDIFQGELRFKPDKNVQVLLKKLAEGAEVDENFMYSLLNFPEDEDLRSMAELSISLDEDKVYDVEFKAYAPLSDFLEDLEFKASAVKDGDDYILLIGSSAEDIAKAEAALKDEKERLKIVRRAEHGSFLQINDNSECALAKELFDDLSLEPKAPFFTELSMGLEPGIIKLALRHNLFEAALGNAAKPESALSLNDPGFKFGGGSPWLTCICSVILTKEQIINVLTALGGESAEEVQEFFSSIGISAETLSGALRSFGFVLGSAGTVFEKDAPGLGGYAFISGEASSMKALSPLFKQFITSEFDTLSEAVRGGWEIFCKPNEEFLVDGLVPLPIFAGVKNGVFITGALNPETIDETPEIKTVDAAGSIFLMNLDFAALTSAVLGYISSPSPLLQETRRLAELLDVNWHYLILTGNRFIPSIQELDVMTVSMNDWGSADMTLSTREVDYKKLNDLRKGFRGAMH